MVVPQNMIVGPIAAALVELVYSIVDR
jgi:hypothetical protein